jgi:hypothetical protein
MPPTSAQFTPITDSCSVDLRPSGYRRIELKANGLIDTQVP